MGVRLCELSGCQNKKKERDDRYQRLNKASYQKLYSHIKIKKTQVYFFFSSVAQPLIIDTHCRRPTGLYIHTHIHASRHSVGLILSFFHPDVISLSLDCPKYHRNLCCTTHSFSRYQTLTNLTVLLRTLFVFTLGVTSARARVEGTFIYKK